MGNSGMGNGAMDQSRHGYALLIAANPPGRQPSVHATAALPTLSAVPPAMLLGLPTGNVVQLSDPDDPQTVLTHLRTAAAHEGPVLVYLAGQLVLDSRQHLPHLSLAGSGSRTVRYTGLPWHWIGAELARRPPESTAVVADLVADAEAWARLGADLSPLAAGLTLYGALSAPPARRRSADPLYSQALAAVLRSAPARMSHHELHQETAARAGLTGSVGPDGRRVLLLGGAFTGPYVPHQPPAGRPHPAAGAAYGQSAPPPPVSAPREQPQGRDPHEMIFAAAREGRHGEASAVAASWEEAALRAGGPASPDAVHWVEVRADLARIADDPARSCALWLHAAAVRLQSGQNPADPEVYGSVDRAHHCWHLIADHTAARELGPRLAELRAWAPGRQPGAVEDVRSRLSALEGELQQGQRGQGGQGEQRRSHVPPAGPSQGGRAEDAGPALPGDGVQNQGQGHGQGHPPR